MVPATLGLGHPRDYQTDRPCPQLGGREAWGSGAGKLWLMYLQRALWSSASRGECAWYGRRFRVESKRKHGPSIYHLKGAQPQGLSGQSPYSEENNWQKFSLIQMYFQG